MYLTPMYLIWKYVNLFYDQGTKANNFVYILQNDGDGAEVGSILKGSTLEIIEHHDDEMTERESQPIFKVPLTHSHIPVDFW